MDDRRIRLVEMELLEEEMLWEELDRRTRVAEPILPASLEVGAETAFLEAVWL